MSRFNEADLFLLDKWTDARLLEDGMEQLRKKYEQVVDTMLAECQSIHRELDGSKNGLRSYSGFGLWKTSWPKWRDWQPGFYIEEIRLDNLKLPDFEAPYKNVWIPNPNPGEVETGLRKTVERIVTKVESNQWQIHSDKRATSIWCSIETREELCDLLVRDEGQGFVRCMVDHFYSMMQFIPAVTEIVSKYSGK